MQLCVFRQDGIQKGAEQSKGRSVIDVGANKGGYTDLFVREGASRIIAIEPGPNLASRLRTKYADDPRVVVRQEGISDVPGMLHGVKYAYPVRPQVRLGMREGLYPIEPAQPPRNSPTTREASAANIAT